MTSVKEIDRIGESFINWCIGRGLSAHTIRAYRQDIDSYVAWLAQDQEPGFSRESVSNWISFLRAGGQAPGSIRRRLACIKAFMQFSAEQYPEIAHNPFTGFRISVSVPRTLPRNVPAEIVEKLKEGLKACKGDHKAELLLLSVDVMLTTGIRVGEFCALTAEDIRLEENVIFVKGKGSRERRVYIVKDSIRSGFRRWLQKGKEEKRSRSARIFVMPNGRAVTEDNLRRWLHAYRQSFDIHMVLTPHMFRHTAATEYLLSGMNLRHVQKLLGHGSIATTEIYTHVSDEELKNAMLKFA